MSLSQTQMEFTHDVALLILEAKRLGIGLTFGEAFRTANQQALYFYGKKLALDDKQGLSIVDDKRKSWTMNSRHLDRLAVDFNFFIDGELTYDKDKLQPLGDFWESLNIRNVWGGNFTSGRVDTPHFERSTK